MPSRSEETLRIVVETISLMMFRNKQLAEVHLFQPLTQVLLPLFSGEPVLAH